MALCVMPISVGAFEEEYIPFDWYIDYSTGTLFISGTTEMPIYSGYEPFPPDTAAPWLNTLYENSGNQYFADHSFTDVVIEDGITNIGSGAFYSCDINSISIPNSVATIDSDAFAFGLVHIVLTVRFV